MKVLIPSLLFLVSTAVFGAECKKGPTIIAVLDTGFGFENNGLEAKLCQYGHKDFSIDKKNSPDFNTKVPIPLDLNMHGTNIVGLIEKQLKKTDNYCIVVVKWYTDGQTSSQNIKSLINALTYVGNIRPDFLNISGGGPSFNEYESIATKRILMMGTTIIAAAGNEGKDIDDPQNFFYPAKSDPRVIVVGNVNKKGIRAPSSNYGKSVTIWENGIEQEGYGIVASGTSQATAVVTGKKVAKHLKDCDIGIQ